jgi:tripartite ATP-independent transporter DctP family solute receptor
MTLNRRTFAAAAAGAVVAAPFVARAQAGAIKLVFSHHLPTSHIGHKAAVSFADGVKAQTNGQVTVDIKPASQLFNLRTSAEALQLGTLDMCWSDLGTLANWTPPMGFVSMPFLFNDFDHVSRVLYGPTGQQVSAMAKDALGVEILCLGASGFRVFLGRKAIHKADDVRGIRLRVPEIPTWVEMARAMGANPTPIPAGEMYTALQTGVIDAIEVPADYIVSAKIYEVAGFACKTHHIFTEVSMMASAKRMAGLPADVQKIIRDNAVRAVQKEMWADNLTAQTDAWNELARRVKANDKPDIASFRSKMGPVLDNFVRKSGPKGKALIEAVQAAAKA